MHRRIRTASGAERGHRRGGLFTVATLATARGTDSKTLATARGTDSKTLATARGTDSKTLATARGTDSKTLATARGTDSKTLATARGTDSKTLATARGTDSKTLATARGTDSKTLATARGTDSKTLATARGTDSKTLATARGTDSKTLATARSTDSARVNWLSHFGPAICLLLVLMILATASAFAHDPGLSAAEVRLDGNKAVARLTFSRVDIATIAPMDADRDGRITQPEFESVEGSLETLAKASFALSVDGEEASPSTVAVGLDESGAVHFDLEFLFPPGSKLTLRSLLIDKLPRGHRQFLALRDAKGNTLGQRMLDAANNSFECDLAALPISQSRPHTFWGFLPLGVEHILLGFDHLAFLFALLIAGGTLREAAKIITSFTVAHSITLALATLEVVAIPAGVVEPLIAASIIYV